MMDDELNFGADDLRQLYDEFVAALTARDDLSRFSREDLLDIFDYTRNIPDDYIGLEVLLVGQRLYPNSKELRKRLVLFLHDIDQDFIAEKISEGLPNHSLARVSEAIKQFANIADDDEKFKLLFSNIKPSSLEDGDVLYLFDLLRQEGYTEFAIEYAPQIAKFCQYPSTIFHEIYGVYIDRQEYDRAKDVSLKLTEIEPFNVEYWIEQANLQVNFLSDVEGALETIEYALAIDPHSKGARLSKINALCSVDTEKACREAEKFIEENGDEPISHFLLGHLELDKGNRDRALELLKRYILLGGAGDKDFFNSLFMRVDIADTPWLIDLLVELSESNPTIDMSEWLRQMFANRCYAAVIVLYGVMNQATRVYVSSPEIIMMVVESLMSLKRYSEVKPFLLTAFSVDNINALPPLGAYVYFVAELSQGVNEKVKQEIDRYISVYYDPDTKGFEFISAYDGLANATSMNNIKEFDKHFKSGNDNFDLSKYNFFM